jgi:dipeptidase D
MINLDSEVDGVPTVGCAGSTDTWIRVDAPRAACVPGAVTLSLVAGGGLGGHARAAHADDSIA